jgi:hypothetical protein
MKKRLLIFWAAMLIFFGNYFVTRPQPVSDVMPTSHTIDTLRPATPVHVAVTTKKKRRKYSIPKRGELRQFMAKLAHAEGMGRTDVVNKYGYMGKYQFGRKTLNGIGFSHISNEEFLADVALQDSAMVLLLKKNERTLRTVIDTYSNQTVNGVYVTKSGILAGAHLVGPGGVLAFFYPEKYNFRVVDGNGRHISDYITTFGGYDI